MKYILEDIKRTDDSTGMSFLIDGSKIAYVNGRMKRLKFPRLNTDGFQLATGSVMHDFSIGKETNFKMFKKNIIDLINKGCTTVVCYSEFQYEKQFVKKVKQTRHNMINSSIDYVIGISIPLKTLTPSLIRKCRRETVAIIRVNIDYFEKLREVAWERIKEAMLAYQVVIIPAFTEQMNSKKEIIYQQKWKEFVSEYKIPTYVPFPNEHERFDKDLCKLIGLFPTKGELVVGSDVDYNLYDRSDSLEASLPKVVVLRGRVIKANDKISYIPGYGREIKIKMPGQFIPISLVHG